MINLNSFFNGFLETINYSEDKDEFINKFTLIIYLKSVDSLSNNFSEDKKKLINKELSSAKSVDELLDTIKNNFDQKSFQDTVVITTAKVLDDYLNTIQDVLTNEQKARLDQFFQSISTQE